MGLPVLPKALDRYLQSKVKQFFITPISNLLQKLMFIGVKTFCLHFLEAIQFTVQLLLGAAQVSYQGIVYLIAYFIWAVLWLLVYIYQAI